MREARGSDAVAGKGPAVPCGARRARLGSRGALSGFVVMADQLPLGADLLTLADLPADDDRA
jgi:hypothetical protein